MKLLTLAVYFFTLFSTVFTLYTPKVAAISDSIVIFQVQTGGAGSGTATQELVLLYNGSDIDIDVTNWCIEYSSASDNPGFNACIESPNEATQLWMPTESFISFATAEFVSVNPTFIPDFTMSGGMSGTSGHVRLYDAEQDEIDRLGWGAAVSPEGLAASAHSSGEVLSRDIDAKSIDTDVNIVDFSSQPLLSPIMSELYELEIEIDVCLNIDGIQTQVPVGLLADNVDNCYEDFCPNLDGLQLVAPAGYEKPIGFSTCEEIPLEDRTLFITELLPNPPSYDSGAEFIEIYNPHSEKISLNGYKIEVGPSYSKSYTFSGGYILAGEYLILIDSITNITLPNSSGVKLRLISPAGSVVSDTEIYSNANDDVSWALVDDQWIYTNQITPGAPNKPYLEPAVEEVQGQTTVYAPCPAGKYRNPETNRCRNIETAVSQLKPCDDDEYRNPETNRCKKIANAASSLKPCDPGEERNPETNRCRKVSTLAVNDIDELPTITDAPVQQTSGSINWGIIGIAVFSTLGYMLYEWRSELGLALVKIK